MPEKPFLRCFRVLILAAISGCGSSSMTGTGPAQGDKVTIVYPPYDQTVPLGQQATFKVIAKGAAPLHYQWSEDGNPISGATGASYTTPDVTTSDNASIFTVTVSNDINSVTSNLVTLTIGPRSPMAGDLRFKQVDAPSTINISSEDSASSNIVTTSAASFSNATGSPFALAASDVECVPGVPYDCAWVFIVTALPPEQSGLTALYKGGEYQDFGTEVATFSTPDTVITSFDLQPANSAFAVAGMQQDSGSEFDMRREVISPGQLQLQDTVAQDAASSRVVTALAFDAQGQINLFSYGWRGDTTTKYETSVVTIAADQLADAAASMASQGYIITAFGGDFTNGFILVGTKVQGDTMARPIIAATQDSPPAKPGWAKGYSPVAWVDYSANGYAVIYEK